MSQRRNARGSNPASSWRWTSGLARGRPLRWRSGFATLLGLVFLVTAGTRSAAQSPLPAQAPPQDQHLLIRGFVKSGNVPIPGVTVTAVNSATTQAFVTSTDVDGSY